MSRDPVSLNALRAFEAAGRHMSFTRAAEELHVTQVAVSRQVRALEEYLEAPLFQRAHRSVQLTDDGKRLLDAVSRAFDDLDSVIASISMRGRRDVLALQAYTTFAQKWLIPRLADFQQRHPLVEVRLTTSLEPVNFGRQNIHAAIRSGHGQFDDCDSDLVVPIALVPVCSPRHAAGRSLERPDDLAGQTLLHSLARRHDWADWVRSAGAVGVDVERGLKFESSALAYEAALQGMGIAIGVQALVAHYVESGELVAPFPHVASQGEGYYLVRPRSRREGPALRAFKSWLTGL